MSVRNEYWASLDLQMGKLRLGERNTNGVWVCFSWFAFLPSETGLHYVAQAGLELVILLPQSSEQPPELAKLDTFKKRI